MVWIPEVLVGGGNEPITEGVTEGRDVGVTEGVGLGEPEGLGVGDGLVTSFKRSLSKADRASASLASATLIRSLKYESS